MAISRYYGPKPQEYVSQFIPENLQLMQNAINMKQSQYDQNKEKLDLYEDMLLKQEALPKYDTEVLKGIRSEFDKYNEELLGKDLADPAVARDVSRFVRNFQRDERLQKINQGLEVRKKYEELKNKYSQHEFQYAIENDPMLRAYDNYLKQEGPDKKFAIDYIQGLDTFEVGVDTYKNKSRYFDNISEEGRQYLQSIGEGDLQTFYKNGWTGRTAERIKEIADSEFNDYLRSPGGKQVARLFLLDNPNMSREELTNELFTDFLATGMKRAGIKTTTGRAGALNSYNKKQQEDARALASVGNTTIGNMGITKVTPDDKGVIDQNISMIGSMFGFFKDFATEASKLITDPENAFGGKDELEWLSNSFEKNVLASKGIDTPTKEKLMTAAINFKNSMDTQQLKGFKNLSEEEKAKKFNEYLDIMPKVSYELHGEIPLDRVRKQQLDDLVTFNTASNATVTPLEGDSPVEQPTLDDYRKAGYKITGRYILKNNPVSPGERLAITLEDEDGNIARVSTKGSLVLGNAVSNFIPSEEQSYVSDLLTQAKYNYENSTYKIPLIPEEYGQLSNREVLNDTEYSPQSLYLETKVVPNGYEINLGAGKNKKGIKFNSSPEEGKNAYDEYKNVLEDISEIYNMDISYNEKAYRVQNYIDTYSSSAFK